MLAGQERLIPLQKEYAVSGYIRITSNNLVPSDKMRISLKYFDEEFVWTLKGNEY